MIITKNNWQMWAGSVAYPSAPDEYNEAAVDRLMQRIDAHVVRVKGVRPQFEPENRVEMMNFEMPEEKAYYDDTEARYLREKAKLEQDILDGKEINGALLHLVLLMKRCEAAEFCRRYQIVKRMKHEYDAGFAPVCAAKFKRTINS